MIIVISGKMGSGKTTVGSTPVFAGRKAVCVGVSDSIRDYLNASLSSIKGFIDYDISNGYIKNPDRAALLSNSLISVLFDGLDPYGRDPRITSLLQLLGTAAEPEHLFWASKTLEKAIKLENAGNVVFLTGCRMPDEFDFYKSNGCIMVRLDVSLDVQLERLKSRDGRVPSSEMLNYITETALDSAHFDIRCNTDNLAASDVISILERRLQNHA